MRRRSGGFSLAFGLLAVVAPAAAQTPPATSSMRSTVRP